MRHFSLWYLEVKVHGLIMLKSPEVPSNTCPTSLRERGMIRLLYNIEFFRSRKTGSGKNHFILYKALFLLFLHVSDHSSRMSSTIDSCLTYWGHLCTPLEYMRILKDNCSHSLWVSLESIQNTVVSGDTPLIQDKHHFLISTFCSFTLPGTHAQQKQSGSFCGCI